MKLRNLIEETTYKIYCDMDGVLTDFSGEFIRLARERQMVAMGEGDVPNNAASKWEKKHGSEEFWKLVASGGVEFWSDMEWYKGGKKLWNYLKKHEVKILSAPSKRVVKDCITGKKIWIQKNLGNVEGIFKFREQKKELAETNAILIDDLKSNIRDWEASGGIGILHRNSNNTIGQLKDLGL
jgi:hypothetical protein